MSLFKRLRFIKSVSWNDIYCTIILVNSILTIKRGHTVKILGNGWFTVSQNCSTYLMYNATYKINDIEAMYLTSSSLGALSIRDHDVITDYIEALSAVVAQRTQEKP